jgi:hypothetical protein
VVHAPRDTANMSTKVKYWKIFNYRLKELTDNVDTKNANPSGASRAMIVLIPLLIFTALIEYLWVLLFGGDSDKYT